MALQNPFHIPNTLGKSVTGAAPKPLPNPWHVANTQGQNITGIPPVYSPPAAAAAAAPAAPAAPDFNALVLTDPQYTTGRNLLDQQNQISLDALQHGFRRAAQSSQDQFNSHNSLFSGAAVNAQRSLAQQSADQQRQQALNYGQGDYNLKNNVFQRLIQQLAGGS